MSHPTFPISHLLFLFLFRLIRTINLFKWAFAIGVLAAVLLIRRPKLVNVPEASPQTPLEDGGGVLGGGAREESPQTPLGDGGRVLGEGGADGALVTFAPLCGLACGAAGTLGMAMSGRRLG